MDEKFRDGEELRQWVLNHLGLKIPRRAFCEGVHDSPMAYLERAFFEREEDAGDVVVWGPRGGGKTRLAAAATLLDLMFKPGVQVRILGGSLEQSLRVWEHLSPDVERLLEGRIRKLKTRRIELEDRSTVAVLTQSEKSVRGLHVQKMRCDEVDMFDAEVWDAVKGTTCSLRTADGGMVRGVIEAFSTYHKVGEVMSRVIANAERSKTRVIKWCILDVMARCEKPKEACGSCELWEECRGRARESDEKGNFADGFVPVEDVIAKKKRMSKELWESEMLCVRPHREGRVFPEFSRERNVRDFEVDFDLSIGVDFGFAAPFVALWIGKDAKGVVHVVDEWVCRNRPVNWHAGRILEQRWDARKIACDPSGRNRNEQTGESSVKVLQDRGFKVVWKLSSIAEGLEQIRMLISPAVGETRLVVHPRCQTLIQAMEQYHYPKKGNSEVPVKDDENDHPVDALRYWVVNSLRRPDGTRGGY